MAFENITLDRVWTSEELMQVLGFKLPVRVNSFNMKKCTDNGIKVLYTSEIALKDLTWDNANSLDLIDKGRLVVIDNNYYNCKIISGVTDGVYGGELKELRVASQITISMDTLLRDEYPDPGICFAWITSFGNIGKVAKNGYLGAIFIFRQITDISISIGDSYLGDCIVPPQISYNVAGTNFNNISIKESLDNQLTDNRTNLTNNSAFIVDIESHFNNLSYGKHEVKLEVLHNNTTILKTITITFNKIKPPIETLPTTSSLKQAIAHNKEIEKEIDYQCIRLKNTLTEKGVEVLPSDKLATLISKVEFTSLKKWSKGVTEPSGSVSFLPGNYIQIPLSNLDFVPTSIIAFSDYNNSYTSPFSVYSRDLEKPINQKSIAGETGVSSSISGVVSNKDITIKDNILYMITNRSALVYNWIAFE